MRSFGSRTLPRSTATELHALLCRAHADEPFSPARPRATARRVGALAASVGLAARLYRGGVELTGAEVDHVWLVVDDVVVDAAFPLFSPSFRQVLPRFVAGEIEIDVLEAAAAASGIDDRVIGLLPPRVRYVGAPVWVDRWPTQDQTAAPSAGS